MLLVSGGQCDVMLKAPLWVSQTAQVQVLPLTGCVTTGMALCPSDPQLPFLKMGMTVVPTLSR